MKGEDECMDRSRLYLGPSSEMITSECIVRPSLAIAFECVL